MKGRSNPTRNHYQTNKKTNTRNELPLRVVGQRNPTDSYAFKVIAIALAYHPENDSKTLLLKPPHT